MSERSLRFARNMSFNVFGQVCLGAVNFFAVPYLVRRMGVETYGLYIILHTAASYLTLASFASGSAVIKHVATSRGAGHGRALHDTLRYGVSVCGVGTLVGGALLFAGAPVFAVRLFHIPERLLPIAVFVLRCVACGGVFVALGQVATSALAGLQRFDRQNIVLILQGGLMSLGALVLVAASFGLRAVASWYVLLSAAACAVAWILLRGQVRAVPEEGRRLPRRAFALWALTSWLNSLSWIVTYQFDKLFIARSLSLTALTLYSVPAGLLQRLQLIPSMVSAVATPMISEVAGPQADESLRRIYLKTTRFTLSVALPILAALFAMMPQALSLWLGGQFSDASCWPARLLVLAQMTFLFNAMPTTVTFSRDRPWYNPVMGWGQALLSVLVWRLLIPRWGLLGVALGSLIAQVVPTAINVWLVHRKVLGIGWRRYFSEVLHAPLLSVGLMAALFMAVHTLATTWVRLITITAAGELIFYAATWALLAQEDRDLVRKYLRLEPRL